MCLRFIFICDSVPSLIWPHSKVNIMEVALFKCNISFIWHCSVTLPDTLIVQNVQEARSAKTAPLTARVTSTSLWAVTRLMAAARASRNGQDPPATMTSMNVQTILAQTSPGVATQWAPLSAFAMTVTSATPACVCVSALSLGVNIYLLHHQWVQSV